MPPSMFGDDAPKKGEMPFRIVYKSDERRRCQGRYADRQQAIHAAQDLADFTTRAVLVLQQVDDRPVRWAQIEECVPPVRGVRNHLLGEHKSSPV